MLLPLLVEIFIEVAPQKHKTQQNGDYCKTFLHNNFYKLKNNFLKNLYLFRTTIIQRSSYIIKINIGYSLIIVAKV